MTALRVTCDGVDAWVAVPPGDVRSRAHRCALVLPALLASSVVFWSVAAVAAVRWIG